MNRIKSVVTRVSASGILSIGLRPNEHLRCHPGQRARLTQIDGVNLSIPKIAYVLRSDTLLTLFLSDPPIIQPGQEVTLTHPRGCSFELSSEKRKLCFILNDRSPYLNELVSTYLDDRCIELSVYAEEPKASLPAQVEIATESDLPDVYAWADAIYFETDQIKYSEFIESKLRPLPKPTLEKSYIFVRGEYGCMGTGECRLCEVTSQNGKRIRLCEQGPVLHAPRLVE